MYKDFRRILINTLLKLVFEKSCSSSSLPHTRTWNTVVVWYWQWLYQDECKPKIVWIFQRFLLFTMLQSSPCLFSPLCKICRQHISVPATIKKRQLQDSVTTDRYSMDYTPGKLLTLTKSTRQQHHKSKGGNPCTVIFGSLGPMIQWWWLKVEWHLW